MILVVLLRWGVERLSSIRIWKNLLIRKNLIIFIIWKSMGRLNIFYSRLILYQMHFQRREKQILFSIGSLGQIINKFRQWVVVEWPLLKANYFFLIMLCVSFLRQVRRRVLCIFPIVFRSKIDLWLIGIVLLFPSLRIITTYACFHGVGKYSREMKQLCILVRCKIFQKVFC